MKEILINILYAIVTASGMTVASFICAFIKKKITEVSTKIENEKVVEYIKAATDIVGDSVLTVSQTFVDTLKKEGKFSPEAQEVAKEKAISIATKLITEDGKNAIEKVYGDFATWLSTTIESNVKSNK